MKCLSIGKFVTQQKLVKLCTCIQTFGYINKNKTLFRHCTSLASYTWIHWLFTRHTNTAIRPSHTGTSALRES